jgi:endonuclease YncB( thermonuclease family)
VFFLIFLGGASSYAPGPTLLDAKTRATQRRTVSGEVISVSDGDTIKVLVNRRTFKIRLYGVDTPEKKQAYGMKAKRFTSSLAFGKNVTVTIVSKDRYGRYVGIVTLPDGRSLNRELVRNGFAWWYSHYAPHDRDLQALESAARREKRQLWSDPHAMAPWDFRRNARQHNLG